MTNQVAVIALDKKYKKLEGDLKKKTEKILLFLKLKDIAIEVYLVGSAKMRQLSRRHRGKDRATNVLAYEPPKDFPKTEHRFLGEVYLCPPYIKSHRENISALLVHGILHLLGFNHDTVSARMTMERLEERLSLTLQGLKKSKFLKNARK